MISSQPIQYFQFQEGRFSAVNAEVIVETPVSLTVNGKNWLTFMCTPVMLEEMAIGFLFNEGIVTSIEDIEDVRLCEHEDNVDIWLTRSVEEPAGWRRTSGCSGGVTAVDLYSEGLTAIPVRKDMIRLEQITDLVAGLFDRQELYKQTGGVHTTALSDGKDIVLSAEDIGRHNTLDKIAGACLRQKLDLPHRFLITTGRISSEMLQKASRMKAEVLVSRTSPSSLSIQLAERMGITLIGYARRNRYNIYAHPERIKNIPPT